MLLGFVLLLVLVQARDWWYPEQCIKFDAQLAALFVSQIRIPPKSANKHFEHHFCGALGWGGGVTPPTPLEHDMGGLGHR